MKNILFIILIFVFSCGKENNPTSKPTAKFKIYYGWPGFYKQYTENIDRDTFIYGDVTFEALDTSEGLEYEWKLGSETIYKRIFDRKFDILTKTTSIPITLIVKHPQRGNDTFSRNFIIYRSQNYFNYFDNQTYKFVNNNNPKDTIRFLYKYNPGFIDDTIEINNCKKYAHDIIPNIYEMAFFLEGNYYSNSDCFFIWEGFLKLDRDNVNKAYLYIAVYRNNKESKEYYTGYRQ